MQTYNDIFLKMLQIVVDFFVYFSGKLSLTMLLLYFIMIVFLVTVISARLFIYIAGCG